jgi:hypothetical protein
MPNATPVNAGVTAWATNSGESDARGAAAWERHDTQNPRSFDPTTPLRVDVIWYLYWGVVFSISVMDDSDDSSVLHPVDCCTLIAHWQYLPVSRVAGKIDFWLDILLFVHGSRWKQKTDFLF